MYKFTIWDLVRGVSEDLSPQMNSIMDCKRKQNKLRHRYFIEYGGDECCSLTFLQNRNDQRAFASNNIQIKRHRRSKSCDGLASQFIHVTKVNDVFECAIRSAMEIWCWFTSIRRKIRAPLGNWSTICAHLIISLLTASSLSMCQCIQ